MSNSYCGNSPEKERPVVSNLYYTVRQAQDGVSGIYDYLTEARYTLPDCLKESPYRKDLDAALEKVHEAETHLSHVLDEIIKTGV